MYVLSQINDGESDVILLSDDLNKLKTIAEDKVCSDVELYWEPIDSQRSNVSDAHAGYARVRTPAGKLVCLGVRFIIENVEVV